MALEETVEREYISLIFVQMNFDGSSVYQRLDTGDIVEGKYVDILEPRSRTEIVEYVSSSLWEKSKRKGKIKMSSLPEKVNAFLIDEKSETEKENGISFYHAQCCKFKKY